MREIDLERGCLRIMILTRIIVLKIPIKMAYPHGYPQSKFSPEFLAALTARQIYSQP